MFNALHMDVYRLVRSKSFWIALAILVVVILFATFSIWFMSTPAFAQMLQAAESAGASIAISSGSGFEQDISESLSLVQAFKGMDTLMYLGSLLLQNGGALLLPIVIIVALFVSVEFETGFAKNVFTTKLSRLSYFFGKALSVLIITIVFYVVSCAAALLSAAAAGFALAATPLVDVLVWSALVILAIWALSLLISLLVWFFRSKVAAVVTGILITAGLVGMIISGILSLLPSLTFLGKYTIMSSLTTLGQGMVGMESGDIIRVFCVCVVFLVLYSAGCILTLKKKDI